MRKRLTVKDFLAVGFFVGAGLTATTPAKADWACEVALCISNPAGPMAVGECVPPITKLHEHLAKGNSFPLCQSADGYVNFTRYGVDRWQDCPEGSNASYQNGNGFAGSRRYCETFVPGGPGQIGGDRDERRFERRIIDGQMVWGEVVERPASTRSKPHFLDYVVEGSSQRLWW